MYLPFGRKLVAHFWQTFQILLNQQNRCCGKIVLKGCRRNQEMSRSDCGLEPRSFEPRYDDDSTKFGRNHRLNRWLLWSCDIAHARKWSRRPKCGNNSIGLGPSAETTFYSSSDFKLFFNTGDLNTEHSEAGNGWKPDVFDIRFSNGPLAMIVLCICTTL